MEHVGVRHENGGRILLNGSPCRGGRVPVVDRRPEPVQSQTLRQFVELAALILCQGLVGIKKEGFGRGILEPPVRRVELVDQAFARGRGGGDEEVHPLVQPFESRGLMVVKLGQAGPDQGAG